MTHIRTGSQTAGVVLVVVSAIVFSTAGIFTKSVETDALGIVFWRGLAAAGFTILYLVSRRGLVKEIRAFDKPALAVTLLGASGSIAFITAFKLTSVANVALIYGAAPFVAAGLSWVFLSEPPTRKVAIASLAGFGGVVVVVFGSLGGGSIFGDLSALWMTLMMSSVLVVYRRYPDTTAALPAALSSIVLLFPVFLLGDPLAAIATDDFGILILFGLIFAVASVTLSEGARRLPSAETALISTLEMPLAPVLAFWILQENPRVETMIGGAMVLGAILWSQRRRPVRTRQKP